MVIKRLQNANEQKYNQYNIRNGRQQRLRTEKERVLRSKSSNAKRYNESLCNRLERIWNDHLTRIEFSHDNRSYVIIEMSPYEILEGRQCRSPLCQDEVVERKMLGPAVVQRTKDMIDLIRGRLVVAQDGHKKYVDLTRKDKEQEVGDRVLLQVFPWKGWMRFGKKGKLSLQFVGPLDILRRLGSQHMSQP